MAGRTVSTIRIVLKLGRLRIRENLEQVCQEI